MDKKEMTTPNTSVGAGAEQSLKINHNDIITDNREKFNSNDDFIRKMQMEMLRSMDSSYLKTISMDELYEIAYSSRPPIIDGLLYPGTYLFVGAPKLGKSFMMMQLAYHISTGTSLWDYPVNQGDVLYLALEDDFRRLQKRLYRMFGTESTEKLHFAVKSNQLENGLDKQLERFIQEYPNTKLIIIDTLQKVREVGGADYSYANDYQVIAKLKNFTDSYGICMLLVHHTRKQKSEDNFDMISGTNGLLGAADGAFLLRKEKRTGNTATLEISGRDQQDQKLYIARNTETLLWELESTETELWKEPPEPLLEAVSKFITSNNTDWQGSPTDLVKQLCLDIQPNTLTKKLNINAAKLLNDYGIQYESKRTHNGRIVMLHSEQSALT